MRQLLSSRKFALPLLGVLMACLMANGCADPKLRPMTEKWIRTELFFGLTTRDGNLIPEAQWRSFLDQNIAPRFPNGFTVLSADGHWLDENHHSRAEPSREILILYPRDEARAMDQVIAAVAADYLKQFNQDSILRGDSRAHVTFYTSTNAPAPKK